MGLLNNMTRKMQEQQERDAQKREDGVLAKRMNAKADAMEDGSDEYVAGDWLTQSQISGSGLHRDVMTWWCCR